MTSIMSSNASAMTLEEKLVQTIKDRELYALVADEDAITKLVERAVREALFQPIRRPRTYGGHDESDSPLIEAARSIAKAVAAKVAEREIEAMIADETTGPLIRKYVAEAMPGALIEAVARQFQAVIQGGMQTNYSLQQLAQRLCVQLQG